MPGFIVGWSANFIKRSFRDIGVMKKDIYVNLFWLLFAIYYATESYGFGLGGWSGPGAGNFPFGAGVLFVILSLSALLKALRNVPSSEIAAAAPEPLHWQNIVLVLGAMIIYALLLERVGFIFCTFCIVLLFIRVIAKKGWFNAILTALVISVAFQVFFNILLNAQIPNGIFKFLLG